MMPVVKLMGWLGLLSPLGITLLYIAHATCREHVPVRGLSGHRQRQH